MKRELGGATAWFTDRHGGVSAPPFDTLNLADHVGDVPAAVGENRARVLQAVGGGPSLRWVQPHHVHGTTVLVARDDSPHGRDADGTATDRPDLALVAIGADCAPIAIANDTACAAVHAGWRGAADGVIAAGVAAVRELGTGPVQAVVGPCVCAGHYEFGADALAELADRLGASVSARRWTARRRSTYVPRSSARSPPPAWTRSRSSTCAPWSRRTTTRTVATA